MNQEQLRHRRENNEWTSVNVQIGLRNRQGFIQRKTLKNSKILAFTLQELRCQLSHENKIIYVSLDLIYIHMCIYIMYCYIYCIILIIIIYELIVVFN